MSDITLVVAMDEQGVIGAEGGMPWRLRDDLRHFKRVTMGKTLLMGRRTFNSIGKPLPGRDNVVLTRDTAFHRDGVRRVHDAAQARECAARDSELMVIGGGQVYALLLPHANRMWLTRVHARVEGDTFFPAWNPEDWTELSRERFPADERNQFDYSFIHLVRR